MRQTTDQRRMQANIQFIGALFKLQLVSVDFNQPLHSHERALDWPYLRTPQDQAEAHRTMDALLVGNTQRELYRVSLQASDNMRR
jgi:hypothetical protein